MIIVLPQGDYSYFVNHAEGGPRYGDYITIDLIRHLNATYRILPGAQSRALGGLSMGATGALVAGFRNPGAYGTIGAHSPSLPTEGERDFLGEEEEFVLRDPVSLALRATRLSELNLWLDVGDEDDWYPRVQELHEILRFRGMDHEYTVSKGDHDGSYWALNVPDYLRFYDTAFSPDRRRQ